MKDIHPSSSTFAFSVPTKSKELSRRHSDNILVMSKVKDKASVQQCI
jgi:hypothetical protein